MADSVIASSNETADTRKVGMLSFVPTETPDMVVVRSYSAKKITPQPPFPRLHPTVVVERAQPYLRQVEEEKKRKPPAIVSLPPATTPWYPEAPKAPILGKPLTPNLPTSLSSPRAQERTNARHQVYADIIAKIGSIASNCSLFYSCLCAAMDDKGMLNAVQLTKVFQDVGNVVDITMVDSLFQLLDVRRKGWIPVLHVIAALDVVLNGPESSVVRRACFEPFNLDQRGYVHKHHLDQLKAAKDPLERDPVRTPEMVKVLNDVFQELALEEEDQYISSLSKGKKAKKKAPPLKANQKTCIPVGRARISHMDFTTFDRFFTKSKTIAVAFTRCWLPLADENTTIRLLITQRIQDLMQEA